MTAPESVRPQILDSWTRSRSNGIDPERLSIRLADVDPDSEFLRVGSRVLLGMSDALVGSHVSLALTDASGVIAWRWEPDAALGRLFDRTEIQVGSSMSEDLAGTNGIAVALHERRAATVVGAEHFKEPWHGWACAAAPVQHPLRGRVAGAVNIACRAEDSGHLMLVVLRSLVANVRTALAETATARERRLMDAHVRMGALADGPVVTLDRHHMIVGDDVAGLGLDRATLWAMIADGGRGAELPVHPGYTARAYPITEGNAENGYVLALRSRPSPVPDLPAGLRLTPLEVAERRVILDALERHDRNKSEVAEYLGISRGTLYERLRRYGL